MAAPMEIEMQAPMTFDEAAEPPPPGSDWFSKIFGFRETSYKEVKRWLFVANEIEWKEKDGGDWRPLRQEQSIEFEVAYRKDPSTLNPDTHRRARIKRKPGVTAELKSVAATPEQVFYTGAGHFLTPSVVELRKLVRDLNCIERGAGKVKVSNVNGDVSAFLADPENRHATFQVASQFNCLEFVSPTVTPEEGITGYDSDRTQGPACSIAAGVATAYRNYFASPVEGQEGQTAASQIDNLKDVHKLVGNDRESLFKMQGGYTMANSEGLTKLNQNFEALAQEGKNPGDFLRIGLHNDVQVTSSRWGCELVPPEQNQTVTQVFGSACAIAYNRGSDERLWKPLATMVLDASFEATLWSAVLARHRHKGAEGSNRVYLTALGGGVFGNDMGWIGNAVRKAVEAVKGYDLDVRIVTYSGAPDPNFAALEAEYR